MMLTHALVTYSVYFSMYSGAHFSLPLFLASDYFFVFCSRCMWHIARFPFQMLWAFLYCYFV